MSDSVGDLSLYLPASITSRYEVRNYRNAAQILASAARIERDELFGALDAFSISLDDIRAQGGSESGIVKRLATSLRPAGWQEMRIQGDLHVRKMAGRAKPLGPADDAEDVPEILSTEEATRRGLNVEKVIRPNVLDGHMVDYFKGRIAFDVEWNSKDQTFDRDLFAFRAFYDCDLIDAAVILTRSADLNPVFASLGAELDVTGSPRTDKSGRPKLLRGKYGASTTWMGKLTYRLDAGRQGGCPVLALGITRRVITDWVEPV